MNFELILAAITALRRDRPLLVIGGALTFFPALTLGPLIEQFLMRAGRSF